MDWSTLLPYLVLVLVALRESLLLVAGLGAKRRTENTAGGQSLAEWRLHGKQMINECLDEKFKVYEVRDRRKR